MNAVKALLLACACAAALAWSCVLVRALNDGGEVEGYPLSGAGYERRAEALLAKGTTPALLAQAERDTRRALTLTPGSSGAWLRLAYIRWAAHNRLDGEAQARLRKSYDLAPFDASIAIWRTRFALEHWDQLDRDLRGRAESEARAFLAEYRYRPDMRQSLNQVANPAGRMAGILWQRSVQIGDNRDDVKQD